MSCVHTLSFHERFSSLLHVLADLFCICFIKNPAFFNVIDQNHAFYSKQNLTGVLYKDIYACLPALLEMSLLLHFRVSVAFSMPTPHWGKWLEIFLCHCWFPAEFFLLLGLLLFLWPCSSRTFSSCCGIFWNFSTLMIPPNFVTLIDFNDQTSLFTKWVISENNNNWS